MTISRRIGRPLLSGIFIVGGLDAARNPDNKVKKAERVTKPLAQFAPEGVPTDTETLVRLNGIVQVVAGAALALGKFRRVAALALMASIIPTTAAGHRFWEETDDEAKAQQMIHFLKNLGLLGGLIITAADTDGAPSLGWRAKRKAHRLGQVVSAGGVLGATTAGKAKPAGRRATRTAVNKVTPAALATAATARRQAQRSIDTVGSQVHLGADRAGHLIATGTDVAGHLIATGTDVASRLISSGSDRAGQLISSGSDRAGQLISGGSDRAGDLVAAAKNALPVG